MAPVLDRIRKIGLPFLTKTAHTSAPFITTFLLIHLSAPALANLGGSSLSSETMLLGREYYQGSLSETLLILAPLSVHVLSGTLKRLLSPSDRPPRRITHLLSITGYASLFLFLPIHFLTHRQYPTLEGAPIYGVGPSELDYEFVKTGLQTWPVRSWFLYSGLVLSTTVHLVDGLSIIWNTWLKDGARASWKRTTRLQKMILGIGVIALPTLMGLYTLAKEPMMTFAGIASRYQAVFMSSLIYRI